MLAAAAYWSDGEFVTIGGQWETLPPDGVLWVDVERGGRRHRMQGHDHYWVDGDRFGCWNGADSRFGPPYAGQRWECDWAATYTDREPPGGHTLHGLMLPDDLARRLGLL